MTAPAPVVAGVGVASVVLALSWRPPRVPPRVMELVAAGVGAGGSPLPGDASRSRSLGLVSRLGRLVRRTWRRPDDPRADRRVGWVTLVAVAVLVVAPAVSAAVVAFALVTPILHRRRRRLHAARVIVEELPDVIDLCRIAVDAGLTPRLAIEAVVRHSSGALVDALDAALATAHRGERLADALEGLRALGPAVHPLVDALVAAERYGAPALAGLDRAAIEARAQRRRMGEESARRVPVKMLFPLVLCTLPALGLLTVVPLLARTLPSLTP